MRNSLNNLNKNYSLKSSGKLSDYFSKPRVAKDEESRERKFKAVNVPKMPETQSFIKLNQNYGAKVKKSRNILSSNCLDAKEQSKDLGQGYKHLNNDLKESK